MFHGRFLFRLNNLEKHAGRQLRMILNNTTGYAELIQHSLSLLVRLLRTVGNLLERSDGVRWLDGET
jgi:hypothetical protein